ncbi:uncharacterized protein LOC134751485 [Cydia strobilella]|uniref:uncharacterized protein LOC134751485 n=1 Tax=Cydia strobilella TaxID=1100964 RepID=UPI0030054F21
MKKVQLTHMEQMVKDAHLVDLRVKLKMAEQIYKYTKMPTKLTVAPDAALLGINQNILNKLNDRIETMKTGEFKHHQQFYLQKQMLINEDQNNFSYMDIREFLIEHYVEKQDIPTKEKLIVDLELKTIFCDNDTLNYSLKNHGFIWRNLPGTKKSILIEHPKRVADRNRYFKKLKQYRSENRDIVYIEEFYNNIYHKHVNIPRKQPRKWCIAAITENSLIKAGTYTYPAAPGVDLYVWLKDELIPLLPKNSVVVVEEKINKEVDDYQFPDALNSKDEIKDWLNVNNVPFAKNMRKAELMTLVDKFTKERRLILEEILKSHGYEVLRKQKGFPNLYVIAPLTKHMQDNNDKAPRGKLRGREGGRLMDALKGCTVEQWKKMFDTVKLGEEKILREDFLLEEIIDKLMSMTSQESVEKNLQCLDNFEPDLDYYVVEKKTINYNKTGYRCVVSYTNISPSSSSLT